MLAPHLTQLPDGPLLRILQFVEERELYVFALLCRRLHEPALRVFLKRRKVVQPTDDVELTMDIPPAKITIISILRIALFIPAIERLTCNIPTDNQFAGTLRRLQALLSKLSYIGELSLILGSGFSAIEIAISDIVDLLREPLVTKSCSRLLITTSFGERYEYLNQPHSSHLVPPITGGFGNLFRHPMASFKASNPQSLIPTKGSTSRPDVTTLVLSSWIIKKAVSFGESLTRSKNVLSSLDTLELACPGLSEERWSDNLKLVAAKSLFLTTLVVDVTDISPNDLLNCVSKLPRLTSLTINVLTEHSTHDIPPQTELSFPPLINLRSPPAYAAVVLPRMQAYKQLKAVHILVPDRDKLFSSEFDKVLAIITSAMQRQIRDMKPFNLVVNFVDDLDGGLEGIIQNLDICLRMGSQLNTSLNLFQKMAIFGLNPLSKRIYGQLTALWLRKFRGLRYVEFIELKTLSSHEDLYPFLHDVHTQNPQIQTVTLNGQIHDVAKLLSEREHFVPKALPVKFPDVPEDIFYLIFQHLTYLELYTLACVSARLREWAIAAYVHRRFTQKPSEVLEVCLTNDAPILNVLTDLSALMLSPINTIGHLSIHIHIEGDSLTYIIHEVLHRLQRLVLKVSTIHALNVSLQGQPFDSSRAMSVSSREMWSELLISVFDAALERSCTLWNIKGGLFFQDAVSLASAHAVSPTDRLFSTFKVKKTRLVASINDMSLLATKMATSPNGLQVDTKSLYNPFFRHWISSKLAATPIDRLTISTIDSPGVEKTLRSLSSSFWQVRELKVSADSPSLKAVLALIHELPRVETLALYVAHGPTVTFTSPPPRLPCLKNLTAPPELVIHLMGTNMDGLPSLEVLTIDLERRPPLYLQIGTSSSHDGIQIFFRCITHLKERPSFSVLVLCMEIESACDTVEYLAQGKLWNHFSNLITDLQFSSRGSRSPGAVGWWQLREVLPRFPAVKHVYFYTSGSQAAGIMESIQKSGLGSSLLTIKINDINQDLSKLAE